MIELIQISIISIIAKLLKFSFEIGTTYFVNKETYGYFALILSYILIFSKISSFGIQNILIRDIQYYNNKKYISYIFFNSAIITISVALSIYIMLNIFNFEYTIKYPNILFIFLLISLTILYSTYLRSIQNIKSWIYFQDIQFYIIYFIILGFVYISIDIKITINIILNIYLFSILLSYSFLMLYIKYQHNFSYISRVSLKKLKYLSSHALPVLFTGLTYLIISRIDIIMLEKYVSLELVGEYNIIARVTLQVLFINQVIVSYYYPKLAKMFASKTNLSKISIYNTKFVLLSFVSVLSISILLFIGIYYFSLFEVLNISNKEKLFHVFLILTITQVLYSAMSFYGNILIYIHKQKIEYLNNIIILLLAITLNMLFIPIYDVVGAAIATSLSLLIGNFFQMMQVKYFTGTFFISIKSLRDQI
jgi:O-antigen/teichoic acid export membrane protein